MGLELFAGACKIVMNDLLKAAMNRLTPLIVRRVGPHAVALPWPVSQWRFEVGPPEWLDDLRLFFTGWAGGLVVFGTFLS